jgi:hypothetical protein
MSNGCKSNNKKNKYNNKNKDDNNTTTNNDKNNNTTLDRLGVSRSSHIRRGSDRGVPELRLSELTSNDRHEGAERLASEQVSDGAGGRHAWLCRSWGRGCMQGSATCLLVCNYSCVYVSGGTCVCPQGKAGKASQRPLSGLRPASARVVVRNTRKRNENVAYTFVQIYTFAYIRKQPNLRVARKHPSVHKCRLADAIHHTAKDKACIRPQKTAIHNSCIEDGNQHVISGEPGVAFASRLALPFTLFEMLACVHSVRAYY